MRKGLLILLVLTVGGMAAANPAGPKHDVFKGKLFPPNVILEHQAELNLSKEQFTAIKAAVVGVQADVAEHEWDIREAYQSIMAELDKQPIDQAQVLEHVDSALKAENEVKKRQVVMLIKLKNLLTDDQIVYLESIQKR
jgi:hypothetical protein